MNRYPFVLAFCVIVLIIASLIWQDNPGAADISASDSQPDKDNTLAPSFQAKLPGNLPASSPKANRDKLKDIKQSEVTEALRLFDRMETASSPADQCPEKSFATAVLTRAPIRINWDELSNIRHNGSGMLAMDITPGRLIVQVGKAIDNWGGGYSLAGKIAGDPLGTFLATVHEDALVASITTDKGVPRHFVIAMNAAGVHELQGIDPSLTPICGGPLQAPSEIDAEHFRKGKKPAQGAPQAPAPGHQRRDNHQTIVDIMILYNTAAMNERGGENATIAAANHAITWTNTALSNSGVNLAFRLAHAHEVDYSESGSYSTDLSRLRGTSDGFMDEIHVLRDAYSADIVSMWLQGDGWGNVGGVGYYPQLNDSRGERAFNLCRIGSSRLHSTFAHECGHNMGCGHHRVQDSPGPGIFDYAAGWRWNGNSGTQWRTIMSYSPGSKAQHFSNPDITYDGAATGSSADNNARTLRSTQSLVSGFRRIPYLATSMPGQDVAWSGGDLNFTVLSNSTWGWKTDADWLISTENLSQTGNHKFSFQVKENTTTEARNATITISIGNLIRTHIVTQSAPPGMLTLIPESHSVGADGGTLFLEAFSNTTWNWSADTQWLNSNSPPTLTGNHTFAYSVAANPLTEPRQATITFSTGEITRLHTVYQEAAVGTLTFKVNTSITPRWGGLIDQFTMSFPASAGETYSIEASTDLKTWVTLETNITGKETIIERNYPAVGALRRFGYFRIRRE